MLDMASSAIPPSSSSSLLSSSPSSSLLPSSSPSSSSSSSLSLSRITNELSILQGHTGRIFSIALCKTSANTRIAASASHDRTVRVWDLETKAIIKVLTYPDFVWRVFFMQNHSTGKTYIVGFISTVEKVYVTDIETGEHVRVVDGRLLYSGPMYVPQAVLHANSSSLPSSSSPCSSSIRNNDVTKVTILVCSLDDDHVAFIDSETGGVVFVLHDKLSFKKVFRATVPILLSTLLLMLILTLLL